jgi:hypothetical protein
MPVTVSPLRRILGRRLGPFVALADFDDALAFALGTLGVVPADRGAVVDGDLATVIPGRQVDQILDVAEWRMLATIEANATPEELQKAGITGDADRALANLVRRCQGLFAYVQRTYQVGLPELRVGVLDLNSLQQDDPANPPINY